MAFFAVIMLMSFVCLLDFVEKKSCEKQTRKLEAIQANAYKWIDENTVNPAVARERKAEIDLMISNYVEYNGRKYRPQNLKQVTTIKEREARNKAWLEGKRYISKDMALAAIRLGYQEELNDIAYWDYQEHTADERREHFIECMMDKLGITRYEAEVRADNFYGNVKGVA